MTDELYDFSAEIPIGTDPSAPVSIYTGIPERIVDSITCQVPPGPNGVMGFQLALSNQQVLPYNIGDWFVWNNRVQTFSMQGLPTTGDWSVVGYNQGCYPHTVHVTFHLVLIPPQIQLPGMVTVNILESGVVQETMRMFG